MRKLGGVLLVTLIAVGGALGRAQGEPPPDDAAAPPACAGEDQAVLAARAAATGATTGRLDEALYNAGVCHADAGAADLAIAAFTELRARTPRSPLAPRALAYIGALEARRAHHADAAAALEEYARLYAGERDAADALRDAFAYRRALGDDARAIADAELFVRTFGARRPGDAAAVTFALTSIHERRGKPDLVLAHLRGYVRRYGARGGDDRLVIAYARIGELLWEASCRGPTVNGACVADVPPPAARCGPISRRPVAVIARDGKQAREAAAAFTAAISAYERRGGRFPGGDEPAARLSYARALFHRADAAYEAYLAIAVPAGLDFDPARPAELKRSSARFAAWLADKERAGSKASAAYEALIADVKEPTHTIAAAARLGQLALHFADSLYTVEIPARLRADPAAVDAYCDTLTTAAEPFVTHALDRFAACLALSTQTGWSADWSPLCERELGRLDPARFPRAVELRASDVVPPAPAPALEGPP